MRCGRILNSNGSGLLTAVDFPGAPGGVPGATPLPPPGSGSRHPGLYDIEVRLRDYAKLGIDRQFLFPQLTGTAFSYLPERGSVRRWRTRGISRCAGTCAAIRVN